LPDALVVATAVGLGAERVRTTDEGSPAVDVPVHCSEPETPLAGRDGVRYPSGSTGGAR
jgi:hypothetical protein